MAAFVFSCLVLLLVEVHRRELSARQKNASVARYRSQHRATMSDDL